MQAIRMPMRHRPFCSHAVALFHQEVEQRVQPAADDAGNTEATFYRALCALAPVLCERDCAVLGGGESMLFIDLGISQVILSLSNR
jgi:hypothetical protein